MSTPWRERGTATASTSARMVWLRRGWRCLAVPSSAAASRSSARVIYNGVENVAGEAGK